MKLLFPPHLPFLATAASQLAFQRVCLAFLLPKPTSFSTNHANTVTTAKTMSSEASRRPAAPANRSSVSLLPRPPCTIHPSAIISDKAIISGTYPVTIGENTVVHPYAKLSTANAPVVIGAHCIIAERASVGLGSRSGEGLDFVVTVEDGVSIETGASVAGKRVGESSVVEVNGEVGAGAVVGKVRGTLCKIRSRDGMLIRIQVLQDLGLL